MRIINILLIAVLAVTIVSCKENGSGNLPSPEEQQIELTILTAGTSTRSPVPDPGIERESQIDELDLLIFKDNKYKYSREAFKLSGNRYKANLKVEEATLTAYVFANCRTLLTTWKEQAVQDDKSWATVHSELVDLDPSKLVSDQGELLPMWGKTTGSVSQTHVSGWGAVNMLRSVASVDVYVEQNEKTEKYILTDAHLYYAPDKGFVAPEPAEDGYKLTSPADMQTVMNSLRAGRIILLTMDEGAGNIITKEAIANQLYLYDNDISLSGFSPQTPPIRKYTRLILAGYYDQPNPLPDPDTGIDTRKKSYYPLDFIDETGNFHDIKRNYKYVFNITSVHGPGYGSLEEAADEYPINMDMKLIEWNRQDEQIGVYGKYYVTIERRWARLKRNAGSRDNISLTYNVLDDIPGTSFNLRFYDDSNGTEQEVENGIQNDYFKVVLLQNTATQTGEIKVEAMSDYDPAHSEERVIIRFRELEFIVTITQYNADDWDWGSGGNQDEEL